MLDTLIIVLSATLVVSGLFAYARWVLSFFPRLNATRLNAGVTKWWILLALIVVWLGRLRQVLDQGSPSQWTAENYWNLSYLFILSCVIPAFCHAWIAKPSRRSTVSESSENCDAP